MKEVRLEITDVAYNRDPKGQYYIKECRLTENRFSGRGHEMEDKSRWQVKSFTYDPEFGDGIHPDVPIKDHESVSLEGGFPTALCVVRKGPMGSSSSPTKTCSGRFRTAANSNCIVVFTRVRTPCCSDL